ncbi:MAG TPA: STAS domain-containing protein, partial [Verrucomicrobiales bacterium]|nr:STAS domain-containing protein [Verrucomicrobiales bacterium]
SVDVQSASYKPVLDMLDNLSRTRGLQGFTPAETGAFIFSLKGPLFRALKKGHGENAEALADDMLTVSALLDKLGLHTMSMFLETREAVIRGQQADMLELSTPVVQLWEGILALPLIGTLDSNRTSIVMETLLQEIVKSRSEIAIIDITGVPTVDTQVAQHLLKTVAAARLMGADCIISGIRPQIAQTMVHLQIDLGSVITKATMAEALRAAMKRSGFVVSRNRATAAPPPQN